MNSSRWTYQVIEIKPRFFGSMRTEDIQDRLNQLGLQGWELVNAIQSGPVYPIRLFMKKAM